MLPQLQFLEDGESGIRDQGLRCKEHHLPGRGLQCADGDPPRSFLPTEPPRLSPGSSIGVCPAQQPDPSPCPGDSQTVPLCWGLHGTESSTAPGCRS